MINYHTLFTRVQDYYADLAARLSDARHTISMTCLAFEDGQWARRLAGALSERAAAGVNVRLMVDALGQLSDEPRHLLSNFRILTGLRSAGVQVDVFQPKKPDLSIRNRQHCKFCAVDGETAYLGGSNVGDYYTSWSDTNLRVDGLLGEALHASYDSLRSFSLKNGATAPLDLANLQVGNDRLLFTIPGHRLDIRAALLKLILNANRTLYLRTWYFLPDREIMDALCSQAESGVQVNVLLSHRTRVRPVDLANRLHIHHLVCAGGRVYRYTGSYMHAKVAWNDCGTVLLGSANLDPHSMGVNFESCLEMQDQALTMQLQRAFTSDLQACIPQTPDIYSRQALPGKLLTHACNLASPWL